MASRPTTPQSAGAIDHRDRIPVDFRPEPLARERDGCRLTGRSITARLAEAVTRLGIATAAAMPTLADAEWSFLLRSGWAAISRARIASRQQPDRIDDMAWTTIVGEAGRRAAELPHLDRRLAQMSPVERIAVLERIEAYGRAEAMR